MEQSNACKVVLLGNSGAGKSSIAQRFVYNKFNVYNESTIGASFFSKKIVIKIKNAIESEEATERSVKFHVWDTAGQEKYHSLAPMYYRGAKAAILVYDICNKPSFDALGSWFDRLKEFGPNNLQHIIVGNKCDLNDERQVPRQEAEVYALNMNCLYLETSARDNINVEEIFQEIARKLPENAMEPSNNEADADLLRLDKSSRSIHDRICCYS
ncbi:Rab5 family GTPase [Chaetoceros tenuissimus]|uniref:Rab5 family GTPase n=1 Tax=Chaetoceros tenuissimus TaxID=426638 RepID=A0AAD3CPE2_9STRA|nr:Rab5 family GTPase [Chaetoceros tenuissimus]